MIEIFKEDMMVTQEELHVLFELTRDNMRVMRATDQHALAIASAAMSATALDESLRTMKPHPDSIGMRLVSQAMNMITMPIGTNPQLDQASMQAGTFVAGYALRHVAHCFEQSAEPTLFGPQGDKVS